MGLINDIKKDKNFNKTIRILILFMVIFFILDSLISEFLNTGLKKYYGIGTNASLALVGHSQTMLGIDSEKIEEELNLNVAKYTREGVNVADRQIMIKQLLNDNKDLQFIVYGVDAWLFTGEGLSQNSYTLFYPFMDEPFVRKYVKEYAPTFDYFTHRFIKTTRFNAQLISGAFRGYLSNWKNLKYGHIDVQKFKESIRNKHFRRINTNKNKIDLLIETVEELRENHIEVFLVYIPTIDLLNETGIQEFNKTIQIFESLDFNYDNVTFFNYLEPYSHDHNIFYDAIHLNPKGQKTITLQLISDLNDILDRNL